jgi:hypothetical protein
MTQNDLQFHGPHGPAKPKGPWLSKCGGKKRKDGNYMGWDYGEKEGPSGTFFDFGALNELRRDLPKITEALGTDQITIFRSWKIADDYMLNPKTCDRAITKFGLGDIPFISVNRLHASKDSYHTVGDGYVLYECRGQTDIKYITAHIPYGMNYEIKLHIIPSKKVYRFFRHTQRQNQLCTEEFPPILEDGLLDEIINNTVGFLMKRKGIEFYGVKIRRGVLMTGEAGNGKTMACRWIQKLCADSGIEWGTVGASEIDRAYQKGEMEELFNRHPVTFFDDIDIEYLNRKQGAGKVACSILSSMDGFIQDAHTIRIFTTNESVVDLDPAFVRPGRIDRTFAFKPPTAELRRRLVIERWPKEMQDYFNTKKEGKLLFDVLIERSEEFSFAELESIRSILVTNKLVAEVGWDLDRAFNDYYKGREGLHQNKKTQFGFNT